MIKQVINLFYDEVKFIIYENITPAFPSLDRDCLFNKKVSE